MKISRFFWLSLAFAVFGGCGSNDSDKTGEAAVADDQMADDLVVVELKPEEMPAALADRRVDAISVWEPYGFYAVQDMGQEARILETKNLFTLSFNLTTKKDFADQHQKELIQVLKALNKATEFIAESPDEARMIIQSRLNQQQDFIDWIWPDYLFKLSLHHSLLLSLENQARWAIGNNLTDQRTIPVFMDIIDKRALMAVLPESVSL